MESSIDMMEVKDLRHVAYSAVEVRWTLIGQDVKMLLILFLCSIMSIFTCFSHALLLLEYLPYFRYYIHCDGMNYLVYSRFYKQCVKYKLPHFENVLLTVFFEKRLQALPYDG